MSVILCEGDLVGAPPSAAELPDLLALFADANVGRTLGGTRTDREVLAIYQRWCESWERDGFGPFAFRGPGREFIGYSGIARSPVGEPGDIELMYAIRPAYWGRGVATRISRLVVGWAFARPEITSLVAYTLTTNAASMGVMTKLGFAYERDVEKAGLPHVLYRLARDGWIGR